MRFGVQGMWEGLGQDLAFEGWGLRNRFLLRVHSRGLGVPGPGCKGTLCPCSGFGFRVSGFGYRVSGLQVSGVGYQV